MQKNRDFRVLLFCSTGIRALLLLQLLLLVLPTQAQASDVYYSIKEELTPGSIFGNVVDDSDLRRKVSPDDLNKLRFSFLTTGNPNSQYFSINGKTGILSVATKIDRETVCSFRQDCQLTVRAVVQMELGSFFHIIAVHVEIMDINDNPPTFSLPVFQVNIPENAQLGVTYPLPTAFDKDTGTNNSVKDYFLVAGHPIFTLSTTQDEVGNVQTALQLLRELNREATSTIMVLVGARDGGHPPLTGTLTVTVTVADVNDNYPVFDKYAYDVNVSETTRTNDPLLKIHAQDADIGDNGNLTYSFSKLQPREVLDLFRMDSISGIMFLGRSVENHTGSIYELVVEASDQGSPPKVSRALVRVRVLDTINSRPDIIVDILMSSSDEQAEASEYSEVGKVVAYVSVNDPDSGENGVTVCRLNTKDFELQPLNNQGQYKVILVTNLDRERRARYEIAVRCNDFGFPQLENTKKFEVIVRDENDNAPQFSQRSYFTTVQENGTANAVIAQLIVSDADVGRNAEVSFHVAGAHRNEFSILDNGTMIATVPLDREVSEKLVVKVIAVDKGFPPLSGSATVFITLEDINDMPPRFSDRAYSFNVPENAKVGSFVGIVAADDEDQGRNAELEFLPAPGPYGEVPSAFLITSEGVVKTNLLLDREKKNLHYFTVVARDGGHPPLSSTTSITIHIDDINDNTPYFNYPTEENDSLSIPHTFPLRTTITRIRADDRDTGPNSDLVYSCASANDSTLFGIDPDSGELFLHRYISPRQVGLYILRIAAHDLGTPQLSNQTLLFVDVYFDNSTLLDPAQATASSKAMMIVLIAVGVVLVVVCVTFIVLLCHRRQVIKKKQQAATLKQQQPTPIKHQGGYYIAPGVCESPAFSGGLGDNEGLNKPVPEQSLDGRGGSSSSMGLKSDVSINKLSTANPYVIMPPHSNYCDPDGPPEIVEISRNGLFHRAEDPYPPEVSDRADDSHFSTFRSQDGPIFRQNSLQRHPADELEEAKHADDTLSLSELSYQSTSDSGRGGSEFDVTNAGQKEKGAGMQTVISSQPCKVNLMNTSGNSGSFRPRDSEVSFATFRGESPCSFRFDSDNDTLTPKGPRQGTTRASPLPLSSSHLMQPHARSLHSVAGASSPAVFRPLLSYGADSASSDEAGSLGRKTAAAIRRALTPGVDISHKGYAPPYHFAVSTAPNRERFGNNDGNSGSGADPQRPIRTFPGTSTLTSPPPSGQKPEYVVHTNTVPPTEFRGRNNLGLRLTRRQVPDYVNAYSDLDSGDDTHMGGDREPTEDDYLLPPYPALLEEREDIGEKGDNSERKALNYASAVSSLSRISDDSFRARLSSEV